MSDEVTAPAEVAPAEVAAPGQVASAEVASPPVASDEVGAPAPVAFAEVAELTRALRGAPPTPVAVLPPEVLRRLTAQIDAGRRHHRAVADHAIAMATRGVPLPVRGIVRKALT
jgi:hypothetical protein